MDAKELWLYRQDVMDYEDKQTEIKSELDAYKNYVLGNDSMLSEIIEEHNIIADEFQKEVEEATKHLQDKLEAIQNKKQEIQTYSRYILINDKLLNDLTEDYNSIKNKWKSSITKYTIGLDAFVASGEEKDV